MFVSYTSFLKTTINIKSNTRIIGGDSATQAQSRAYEKDWARWDPGWSNGGGAARIQGDSNVSVLQGKA